RVARPDQVRRHVDLATVHPEVPVPHQLPRLCARRREPDAVDRVVEPALEQLEQRLAGHALGAIRHREVAPELSLEDAVHAAQLLLLAQLDRVLGELRPRLAVLAGWIVAALDGALVRVAALALEEQLESLAAAQTADRSRVSCHVRLLRPGAASAAGSRCAGSG